MILEIGAYMSDIKALDLFKKKINKEGLHFELKDDTWKVWGFIHSHGNFLGTDWISFEHKDLDIVMEVINFVLKTV